jgi:hypothetical protein
MGPQLFTDHPIHWSTIRYTLSGSLGVNPLFEKQCLIFGCGNPLLGDDGFGPEVIERLLADHALPEWVGALDVGTAIRDILFDLLLVPHKPERLIVIDAMDRTGRPAGDILEIEVDAISPAKIVDFSLLCQRNPSGRSWLSAAVLPAFRHPWILAHSGYYVHLVEKSAGIGGVMAQLDKTYPTNDCAM